MATENPTWTVPKSTQREIACEGLEGKTVVPPGPDNPLAEYALNLSIEDYPINHRPAHIYHFATYGCIRLHSADIKDLYQEATIGEINEIIYEFVLMAALSDGQVFLEVNLDHIQKASSS